MQAVTARSSVCRSSTNHAKALGDLDSDEGIRDIKMPQGVEEGETGRHADSTGLFPVKKVAGNFHITTVARSLTLRATPT
ncbi:hypothetical protein GBAR_LOCUS18312 [Geodia barretti]|uniref:Uncharacterized protein n=1 Tax=Geodia barretti TaxID=519541 RepID=A0AA35WXH7_GEOBA|nr:hypothetical protein GBAR_LOCUS18312 [Geodia barretti]